MKDWHRRRSWRMLGLTAVLMGGLGASALTGAEASSRRNARGYDRDRVSYYRARDLDRDCIPDYRDWDRDGDSIRNSRDRHPNRPDRYYTAPGRYRYTYTVDPRQRDLDRDCIPNYRDWDRDGDRVPNWRDRRPNNRRYR